MGLKEAQFNDALSFVTQYKDGIIKSVNVKSGGAVEKGELMIEMA